MPGRILWVDSDRIYLDDHLLRLRTEGFHVKQAYSLSEGADEISDASYDLLILDCLMPVQENEEADFPPEETDSGKKAGVVFYMRVKHILQKNDTPVLVFTIREEPWVRQEFLDAGLPKQNYMTKAEGADTDVFLKRVREVLGGS